MKYEKMLSLITEKNYYYKIPSDGRELIFDFYLVSTLLPLLSTARGINASIDTSFREAADMLIPYLKDLFLKNLYNAIKKASKLALSWEAEKTFNKRKTKSKYDNVKLFRSLSEYEWNNVAKIWLELHDAERYENIIKSIDDVIHLEHESGSIFDHFPNKDPFRILANDSDLMFQTLQKKATAHDPRILVDEASPIMRNLALVILRGVGKPYDLLKYIKIGNRKFAYRIQKNKRMFDDVNISNMDLEELPDLSNDIVLHNFDCSKNNLKSLKGSPERVGSIFNCSFNDITSLDGAPKEVGKYFICAQRGENFTEEDVKKVSNVKGRIILEVSPDGEYY
jgi:hypothetical protein